MGYYTTYDFSMNDEEVIKKIEETSGYGKSYEGFYYEVKWYNSDEHMKTISTMFPDKLILLEGDGEDNEDKWKAYYKNGKSFISRAKITIEYEEFSEEKLK